MTMNVLSRLTGVLFAVMLFAAACSGGDDSTAPSAQEIANDPANAPIEQIDEASGGVAEGPIVGLLTVQPSFGFGVYDVDPATGQARAVPGIASVETVDRNRDLTVGGGAAYSLGGTVREGQTFASDISVVKINYATGQVSQLAALGFDRETDDSQEFTSYTLQGVAGDRVVVSAAEFGSDEGTYTVYDANSGAEKASFPRPFYEFTSDTGTCSGNISNLIGLSDGRLMGTGLGSPAYIDLDTCEVELIIGCDQDDPQFSEFVTPSEIADYAVFDEGPALTDDQLERLLQSDLNPEQGFVEGGGDLWWIEADVRQVDDATAIIGGVVQFDLEAGAIKAVHPLGAKLGEFLDDDEGFDLTTLEQAQLRYLDGRLVMVDGRENGSIFTLDPSTGTITETAIELGEGVDYTSTDLLAGDPDGIWLEVGRRTITRDDESGRSSFGPTYIEHFDLATNQIDLSLAAEDLFFS